ncbi:hypothetical protein FSC37_10265 [Piscinibacter aquaticus]|uniref:Uncharacterized protein n=1 Tax=Piscinibacter aquaticus TaxID=392597 RepID=A0A5C6TZQ5_9BURK|nr:hypothetical protein FSC37_10265 [Piscinibacter aquaticus]
MLPQVRRKLVPGLPPATSAAFTPEPALDTANYEHILSVLQNMAHVMERSPTAFAQMGEEDLRQHFLVQLNGQFEGAATAETFNVSGKTDILLRANGRNVFIAECKFWKGPKHYRETIDQLLGYTAARCQDRDHRLQPRDRTFNCARWHQGGNRGTYKLQARRRVVVRDRPALCVPSPQ